MKATIIGAGIGGLTTGIALQRAGIDFEIFEAAPELKPIGAGIVMASNAMQVFKRLGIERKMMEAGVEIVEAYGVDWNFKVISGLSIKEKVAPRLMPSLLAIREAPWACVSDLQIASPKPRPPKRSFKERSPCSNGSKILSITSGAIPTPSSCTLIVSCCGDSFVDEIITLPACPLNLKAFLSRFQMIC